MRGTVLLLDSQDSRRAEAEDFRANELMVHEAATPEEAFTELEGFAPDVVVFCPDRAALELNWRLRNGSLTRLVYSPGRLTLDDFNTIPHLSDPGLWTYR